MSRKATKNARQARATTGRAMRRDTDEREASRLPVKSKDTNGGSGPPCTASEMAVHLDLTTQRVTQLANEGVLPRRHNGKYPQDATRIAYIRFVRRQAQTRARTGDKTTGLIETKTLKAKLDLAIAQRDYVNIDEVEAVMTEVFATLRNEFSGIGASVTRDLQLRATIDQKINDGITRARKALQASAANAFHDSGDNEPDDDQFSPAASPSPGC